MKTIYIYVLDTLADWEIGYVTAELNSKRFFKSEAPLLCVKTVGYSKDPISTMGGIQLTPDCLIEEIELSKDSVLLLPGADTWNDSRHHLILNVARELLSIGGLVGAICGATVALANVGLLNKYSHTSNGIDFLEFFSENYHGQQLYKDQLSVSDNNLITAGSAGGLMWTKQIIEKLNVYAQDTLEDWYNYFSTGNANYFFELMNTLPKNSKN